MYEGLDTPTLTHSGCMPELIPVKGLRIRKAGMQHTR